jgi:hypothetical protein
MGNSGTVAWHRRRKLFIAMGVGAIVVVAAIVSGGGKPATRVATQDASKIAAAVATTAATLPATSPTTTPPTTAPPTTRAPSTTSAPERTAPATAAPAASAGDGCTPGYDPCIPPGSDVDCAGGSGNGPRYVKGPVRVTGADPYGLDRDGNGVGCQ